ncbi:nitroreductase family protein [Candidatus Woesearchaeota archaeon]|nr:nitroreductase family protein [Candidatus Woesearchaeota archaeon]
MNVLEAIKKRRSIRKYKDVGVEWDNVVHILEAGRYAPSAGNLQDWKFIVVTEEDIRAKVARACLNQSWMETAPVHIVICSILERQIQHYGDAGKKYAIEDASCAAMAMMLEATELGISSCWVGAFDEMMLRVALNIPDRATPTIVLTMGYADEEVPEPTRTVLESVVFLQHYANRIKNENMVMWNWSLEMEKQLHEGKHGLKKRLEKVKKAVKEKLEKKMRG